MLVGDGFYATIGIVSSSKIIEACADADYGVAVTW